MGPERIEEGKSIQINFLDNRRIKLIFPGGGAEILSVPKNIPGGISDIELAALTTARLAIPLAFPGEAGDVDQAGFFVRREEAIHSLPQGREEDYRDALAWSGAVLQGKGWDAERVANLLMKELPSNIEAGLQLGSLDNDVYMLAKARLRKTIASTYPGAAYSIKKRRKRKIPDW